MPSRRFARYFLLSLAFLSAARTSLSQSEIYPVPISILASDGNLYGTNEAEFFVVNPSTGAQTIIGNLPYENTLCLERSDGTLLTVATDGHSPWQALAVSLNGTYTVIATFPAGSYPECPAIADDGNYYGSSAEGGSYGDGYLYQLTAAGQINNFYNFTGGADGTAPDYPPVQGVDGSLYWYSGSIFLRYSTATGLTPFAVPDSNYGPLAQASDGNFYSIDDFGTSVVQITPQGKETVIYTPTPPAYTFPAYETGQVDAVYLTGSSTAPLATLVQYDYDNLDNDDCSANGNYLQMLGMTLNGGTPSEPFTVGTDEYEPDVDSAVGDAYYLSMIFGGNGSFYTVVDDFTYYDPQYNDGICHGYETQSVYGKIFAAPQLAPITMALSQTHVKPGGSATLTWRVNNAYNETLQQCFGFGGLSGKVALSGSTVISAPSSGSYVTSIVCGGTETSFVTLASTSELSLKSSAKQVNQGSSVTLTATLSNPGTPAPTGKVNFLLGSTVIGSATLVNGVAKISASTAGVPAGTYNISASYVGDVNYAPATSAAVSVIVVAQTATSTALTPASQSVLDGAMASLVATVTGSSTHGAPMGTVKFTVGTTAIGTAILSEKNSTSSVATLTASTAGVAPGAYSVTSNYSGDQSNSPSSSNAVTVTVKPSTPMALTVSPNPVATTSSFTLTATVNGKDNPSGTVFFYANGTQVLASNAITGGVAIVTVPAGTLSSGTYQITASYAGDANNPAGISPGVTLTVN